MINKKCRGTEQPLVMVEWDMARAFISAAATEKLERCELGVYEDEGLTVKGAWGMDLKPLRIPEAPVLEVPEFSPQLRAQEGRRKRALDGFRRSAASKPKFAYYEFQRIRKKRSSFASEQKRSATSRA
jgi:hypothetical protein